MILWLDADIRTTTDVQMFSIDRSYQTLRLDFPEVEYPLFYRLFRHMYSESIYKTIGYKDSFWEYCP